MLAARGPAALRDLFLVGVPCGMRGSWFLAELIPYPLQWKLIVLTPRPQEVPQGPFYYLLAQSIASSSE